MPLTEQEGVSGQLYWEVRGHFTSMKCPPCPPSRNHAIVRSFDLTTVFRWAKAQIAGNVLFPEGVKLLVKLEDLACVSTAFRA